MFGPKNCLVFLLLLAICACAAGKDGEIIVNRETIEDFFEKEQKSWSPPSDLDLVLSQKVTPATLPRLAPGLVRVTGVLNSVGPYRTESPEKNPVPGSEQRGSVFKHSVFGMLGPAGGAGNAWFYADLDPATGNVADARAYLYGFNGGVCDMRRNARALWNQTGKGSFALSLAGPCLFPDVSGSASEYALLVQTKTDPLTAKGQVPLRYIIDSNGEFDAVPVDPQNWWAVQDYGTGEIRVER